METVPGTGNKATLVLLSKTVPNGFQDDFYSAGSPYRGTTWRTYDSAKKRWVSKWLQAGTDTPGGFTNGYFYGVFKDGEIHLKATGKDQQGEYMDRITFYEITKTGFRWKLDRSYDNGKTWIKNMRMVEAKRIK